MELLGLPGDAGLNEPNCRRGKRNGFDPWVAKFPGVGNGTSIVFLLENSTERRLVSYSLRNHTVRSTNGAQS